MFKENYGLTLQLSGGTFVTKFTYLKREICINGECGRGEIQEKKGGVPPSLPYIRKEKKKKEGGVMNYPFPPLFDIFSGSQAIQGHTGGSQKTKGKFHPTIVVPRKQQNIPQFRTASKNGLAPCRLTCLNSTSVLCHPSWTVNVGNVKNPPPLKGTWTEPLPI